MLTLYNTLTRKKEPFEPLRGKNVGLYSCGPTVYGYTHIGNLRAFMATDILVRILKRNGYDVTWVMNTTDVDDKTIARAQKNPAYKSDPQGSLKKVTQHYEGLFWDDLEKISIPKPDVVTRATEYIEAMQGLVRKISDAGYAYERNGSVYFNVKKYADDKKYGQLVDLDLSALKTGTRVDLDEYKKEDVQDFVLWKAAKGGEPQWDFDFNGTALSGRPGWHIECSAMPGAVLDYPFDIHTGGVDLKFPHHENEIAQSTAGFGEPPARFWVHNEHILVDNEKMAKSKGNFYTLRDIEKRNISPLAFRYFVLGAHYRSKLNFTWEALEGAEEALKGARRAHYELAQQAQGESATLSDTAQKLQDRFNQALNDDLNTPQALAVLHDTLNSGQVTSAEKIALLVDYNAVFDVLPKGISAKTPANVTKLVAEREAYRTNQQFVQADELREKIKVLGYIVEDTPNGPKVLPKEFA